NVATDFLEAATSQSHEAALGLVTEQLAKALQRPDARGTQQSWLLYHLYGGYSEPRITAHEVSPSGNEGLFKGLLTGAKDRGFPDADFSLRVIKPSEKGPWQVRFFSMKEREVKRE